MHISSSQILLLGSSNQDNILVSERKLFIQIKSNGQVKELSVEYKTTWKNHGKNCTSSILTTLPSASVSSSLLLIPSSVYFSTLIIVFFISFDFICVLSLLHASNFSIYSSNLLPSVLNIFMKLKLQYFGYLMQRADSLKENLMLGKTEGRRRRGRQDEMVGWHHRLNGQEFEQTPGDSEAWCAVVHGVVQSDTT